MSPVPNDELWLEMSSRLREKARDLYLTTERLLDSWGYRHRRIASGIPPDDLPGLCEELPQKTLGTLCGLGWVGRSSLLVSPEYGSRIRIGAILTDMPLVTDEPITESRCNGCMACVEACPVGAISGAVWTQSTARHELMDVSRCHEYLWSTRTSLGRRQTCGICLQVCPIGRS
jgi:ferredoxin